MSAPPSIGVRFPFASEIFLRLMMRASSMPIGGTLAHRSRPASFRPMSRPAPETVGTPGLQRSSSTRITVRPVWAKAAARLPDLVVFASPRMKPRDQDRLCRLVEAGDPGLGFDEGLGIR